MVDASRRESAFTGQSRGLFDYATAHADDYAEHIRCPICRRKVFVGDHGTLRLRTRILVFENGQSVAKCRYCRNDVVVPVVLVEAGAGALLSVWDEAFGENSA